MTEKQDEFVVLSEKQRRARRNRSIALALALAGFVVIMYLVTVVKMGPEILNRPM